MVFDGLGSKHALLHTFLVTKSFSLFKMNMQSRSDQRRRTKYDFVSN